MPVLNNPPLSFSFFYLQLDGTIIALTDANAWGSGLLQWLDFTKLIGITVKGSGKIDGNGAVWWQDTPFDDPIDDESKLTIPFNSTMQRNIPIPVIFAPPKFFVNMLFPFLFFLITVQSFWQLNRSLGGKMPGIKPTVRTTNAQKHQATFLVIKCSCEYYFFNAGSSILRKFQCDSHRHYNSE